MFIQKEHKTLTYHAAFKWARRLMAEGGVGMVQVLYAEVASEEMKKNYFSKQGLKESRGELCARRLLLKKQCTSGYGLNSCEAHRPPCADHEHLYNKNGKPYLYLSQPYEHALLWENLVRLVDFCKEHGLKADVSVRSWYYPGATSLIEIKRQEK